MKTFAAVIFGMLLLIDAVYSSAIVAQSPQESLMQLEGFLGEWEGKFDPPGNTPMGTVRTSVKQIAFNSGLHFETTFVADGSGKTVHHSVVVVAYNWKTKAPHAWRFEVRNQATLPVRIGKNKLVMEGGDIFGVDGKRPAQKISYELKTPDEFTAITVNPLEDGTSTVDDHVVLKRVRK